MRDNSLWRPDFPMQLTLAVPGLLALPLEVLATIDTLSRFAAHAGVVAADDLDAAILAALGASGAAAPLALLGAGLNPGPRWAIRADPVTMSVGRDDVRLDQRVDDLDPAEAATLHRLISAHFASDGLVVETPRTDTWFIVSDRPFAIETTALGAALGHSLRARLPGGPDAGVWRRWFTEAQMLLHEHSLSSRAPHPVNALWFSGGGILAVVSPDPSLRVFAGSTRDSDTARGLASLARGVARPLVSVTGAIAASHGGDRLVVVHRRAGDLGTIRRDLDAAWLALERGTLDAVALVADDVAGRAACWRATRPTWLQRLRPRRAQFAMPSPAGAA